MLRAPKICQCGKKIPAHFVCECVKARHREYDKTRPSSYARGYGGKWKREAKAWLDALGNPKCFCGCGNDADTVDHKVAHKGDQRLMWDRSNWQPAYGPCNNRKAARREGAFGNPIR